MALGKRVKEAREAAGLKQAQLGEMVGISQTAIHLMEQRDSKSSKFVVELAQALGVTAEWLKNGGEQPVKGPAGDEPPADKSPSNETHVIIPRYNIKAACGNGFLNDHVEVKGGLAFRRSWLRDMGWKATDLVVVYASQESMWPTITDGAVLLVDTSKLTPESGKVYLINWFGEERIKRLFRESETVFRVASDNPNKTEYPDERVDFSTQHGAHIIGRVVWQGGTL